MSINIIWDFDGVIADSEMIWVENRRILLKEKHNIDWDIKKAYEHFGGTSDATKDLRLKEMGIDVGNDFWVEALKMDYVSMARGDMLITPDVEDIFKEYKGRQCVATGGIFSKTKEKIINLGIGEYFDDSNVFCADMVSYGKPEPDVFLLAQETMGWDKKDCVIIEDSIAGMIAGKRAGIRTAAYLGNTNIKRSDHLEGIKNMGISDIYYDMKSLKDFLNSL